MARIESRPPAADFSGPDLCPASRTGRTQGCVILQPYDMEMGARHVSHRDTCFGPWAPSRGAPPMCSLHAGRRTVPLTAITRSASSTTINSEVVQTVAAEHRRPVSGIAGLVSASIRDPRYPAGRGQLGIADAGCLGPGLGNLAEWHGSHADSLTSSKWVAWTASRWMGEITYGLERLAMYLQGVQSVYDLLWADGPLGRVTYRRRSITRKRSGAI